MNARSISAAALLLALAGPASAQEAKLTVSIRGAACARCVAAAREAIAKLPGVRVAPGAIEAGERPRFFSSPFVIELADVGKTDLGAVAKAVADAKTPHREEIPPRLNVVLFGQAGDVTEPAVVALRSAFTDVPGFDPGSPGGTGGIPQQNTFWVRVDATGGASFSDLKRALEAGSIRYSLLRP